jgi:signal transduction histidine kinase
MGDRGWVDRYAVPVGAIASLAGWALLAVLMGPRTNTADDWTGVLATTFAVVPALLGWRIVALKPGNVIGRRLVLLSLALMLSWVPGGLGFYGAVEMHDTTSLYVRWCAVIGDVSWLLVFLAMIHLVIVFPDGRYPSPAWKTRARLWSGIVVVGFAFGLFRGSDLTVEGHPEVPRIVSPLPSIGWAGTVTFVALLVLVVALIATVVAIRGRFKSSTGIERLQLSWLAYASALIPLSIIICIAESAITGEAGVGVQIAIGVTTVAIPLSIAVAVLRYRLYEIERLVNRTLVYVALTGALAIAYGGVALVVGVALGGGAVWATGAATLAVAMAFRPARDATQRAVDRRFARRRYEGLRLMEKFLDDVRAGRAEPEEVGAVLSRALDDEGLEVFFRLPASGRYADHAGRLTELPDDELRARMPVRRGELELGMLLHDPALDLRADTSESIVRAAGLAIEIARLRVEVRVQLAEVEASRARIVAAAEAERGKLERDLHDGAQQRLVALGLALRHAQSQLGADPSAAGQTLDDAVGEVTTAVAELREIARGLRPGVLEAGGLSGALTDVARRVPIPVALELAPDAVPPELEADTFFLACEAVTNAVKHSGARHIRVRVDRRGELLLLEVADDGVGGARSAAGGGLAGMAERAAQRGGQLRLVSPPGGGTTIRAELPVGAG